MMSTRMLKATGGYDCVTISEDAEYYFNRLFDGYKGHFVEDAVVSEDMPSSLKDTYNRNKRIGSGSVTLLKPKFAKMFGQFFKTGDFSYMEICLTYSFLFLTVLLSIWLPAFYVYNFIFLGFAGYGGMTLTLFPVAYYQSVLWNTIIIGASIILGLFIFFGYLQALVLVLIDYKKIGVKKRRELISAVFLFPAFLVVYSITICIGTMSKPTWGKAKRNAKNQEVTQNTVEQTSAENIENNGNKTVNDAVAISDAEEK
jgi:cellulose synthase/poly-beta-1,6-N-acetylglucosamine synthase-like glycosyltransferase